MKQELKICDLRIWNFHWCEPENKSVFIVILIFIVKTMHFIIETELPLNCVYNVISILKIVSLFAFYLIWGIVIDEISAPTLRMNFRPHKIVQWLVNATR